MYGLLSAFLGRRVGAVVLGFLYAAMIAAILYSVFEPQAELKYTAL